ncbi:MAG: hypothetical protein E6J72_20425 [Deltaproteobacteria bacterium]|nr:MAG: hypothetical protein E6J72_20425 [Deltaproteobacteria bacterium]
MTADVARVDDLVRLRPWPEITYTSQGRTVLAMRHDDGTIHDEPHCGLFVHETRMLSRYSYTIDGDTPLPIALSNVAQHSWLGYYAALPPERRRTSADRRRMEVAQHSLELRVSRYVGGGMHEDLDCTNFTQQPTRFALAILVDADFADQAHAASASPPGRVRRIWDADRRELRFEYHAEPSDVRGPTREGIAVARALALRIVRADSVPSCDDHGIRFEVELMAHASWHACLDVVPTVEGEVLLPCYGCRSFVPQENHYDRIRHVFLAESTRVQVESGATLAPVVVGAVEQATRDLASLRLHDLDVHERAWTVAAGLPTYVALFGRDTLTAAWQAELLGPELMQGTLEVLARFQGRGVDNWRDEQPGRMLHEAHTSPSALLGCDPRRRYYGSVTTSGFYPVVVAELWHWTGDRELVRRFVRPALDGLRWLDTYAARHGGFYYHRRSRRLPRARSKASSVSRSSISRRCCGGSVTRMERGGSTAKPAS